MKLSSAFGYFFVAMALIVSSPSKSANTALQWGVDKTQNPNLVCAYDATNTCQPAFTNNGTLLAHSGVNTDITSLLAIASMNMSATGSLSPSWTSTTTGAFFTGGQAGIQMCNEGFELNCGANNFSAYNVGLVRLSTTGNASVQENNANFNMSVATGFFYVWANSTNYSSGNYAQNGTQLYVQTVATCTSAASPATGPTGTTSGQSDGTCSWNWIGPYFLAAKNNLQVQTKVYAGAGHVWGMTNGMQIIAGYTGQFVTNLETDTINNTSVDPVSGGTVHFYTQYFGGTAGTNPITANIYISPNANGGVFATHDAIYINGSGIEDHSINENSQATIGYYGQGVHSVAGIVEADTAPIGLKFNGTQTNAISIGGTLSGSAINFTVTPGNGVVMQIPSGAKTCLNGTVNCIWYNGSQIELGSSGLLTQSDINITPTSGNANFILTLSGGGQSWRMTDVNSNGNLNIADNTNTIVAMAIVKNPLANALTILGSGVQLATVAYGSTLPTCNSGALTSEVNVSNSNVNTFGSSITGTGSYNVKARCNGTNWTVEGI